jgi:hypothetical protein
MSHNPVQPLLDPLMRCPRCRMAYRGFDLRPGGDGFPRCQRRHPECGQRWWAMALSAGEVEPQLAEVFGEECAHRLMTLYPLPCAIGEPMFWQLPLSGHQYHHTRQTPIGDIFHALVRIAVAMHQQAPSPRSA